MELLIALLMMLWGNVEQQHPTVTMTNLVHAISESQQPQIEELPIGEGSGDEWTKIDPQKDTAPIVRGLYTTAHTTTHSRFDTILQLIDDTDLNSLVIDIKDDWGVITYNMELPDHEDYITTSPIIRDIDAFMDILEEHDIYPIARIVVFKDTKLAEKHPELSFINADGTVWKNSRGESFVNPYNEEVWNYNIEIAKEAVKAGFKEIQFDYVRFPEGFEKRADVLKHTQDERSRIEVVADFVKEARRKLNPLGVRISVDIFGYAASVPAAEGIGQDFNAISKYVDVISPMVYPSHYSTGWFNVSVPDAAPYQTIDGAMKDTHEKLAEIEEFKPVIRPWIQDFTATWVRGHIRYGKEEVEAQIKALQDNGIEEFLLWNASNKYTPDVNYIVP